MAASCLNHLNYIAIAILYVVSIYFAYQPYTEIIGFYLLFVVNAAFMLFFRIPKSTKQAQMRMCCKLWAFQVLMSRIRLILSVRILVQLSQ